MLSIRFPFATFWTFHQSMHGISPAHLCVEDFAKQPSDPRLDLYDHGYFGDPSQVSFEDAVKLGWREFKQFLKDNKSHALNHPSKPTRFLVNHASRLKRLFKNCVRFATKLVEKQSCKPRFLTKTMPSGNSKRTMGVWSVHGWHMLP